MAGGEHAIIEGAARSAGIEPRILWGVYGTESSFGRDPSTSSAGAEGPFQFEPGTARSLGVNPHDFRSAAYGAAKYLAQFKGRGLAGMLSAYNAGPAGGIQQDYVNKVLSNAASWQRAAGGGGGGGGGGARSGGAGGGGFAPNVGGGVLRSGAQTSDLLALIDALAQKPSASTSVEGLSVPKPAAEPQAGPRVPQQLPEGQATSPASLLGLIGKIGEEGSSEAPPSAVTGGQAMPSGAGIGGHAGYVNPIRGARIGRTDMGVDVSAAPGTPIRAIGNAKVLGINPGWYAGQPYVYYELLDGPRKGQVIYEAEQIAPHVRPGEFVKAGQPIGVVASHGTGIEQGFGTHGWQTRAQAEGNTGDSAHNNAPAGVAFARFLAGLR